MCQFDDSMCEGDYDCMGPNVQRWGSINNNGQCFNYDGVFNSRCYNAG